MRGRRLNRRVLPRGAGRAFPVLPLIRALWRALFPSQLLACDECGARTRTAIRDDVLDPLGRITCVECYTRSFGKADHERN